MDNNQLADNFSMLSKLMDIHGENSFKSKSYAAAAFAIEKLIAPLSSLPADKIAEIKGIGSSAAQKISEMISTGRLAALEEIIMKTPPGVIEMLNIKGLGPKKIFSIWKEMEIENIGELLYACKENRLKLYKGFGEKTQQNVADSIEFYQKSRGSFLYAQLEDVASMTCDFFRKTFPGKRIETTGDFARQLEVINELEFLIEAPLQTIKAALATVEGFELITEEVGFLVFTSSTGIKMTLHATTQDGFVLQKIKTSSSEVFFQTLISEYPSATANTAPNEDVFFQNIGLQSIPAPLRETGEILHTARAQQIPALIQHADIRGIIHCHSTWSDGSNSIEELANAAISRGMEYLVISDHSKSAFYAQGLQEDKIIAQHEYIDELNEKLYPFKIFKSIESDILNDGNLDYSDKVLASFDLVIASVHSNLKMTEEKAMERILRAIKNPFTTILGHMTGRLLLSRPGYPVNHELIAETCQANHVVVELNAHPNRLDIDWRHIHHVTSNKGLISIDPDAHFIDGLDDVKYGVLVAQKAMLTKDQNLSSFGREAFQNFVTNRKRSKKI